MLTNAVLQVGLFSVLVTVISVPLGLIAVLLVATTMPFVRSKASLRDIDFVGAAVLAAGLVPLMVALSITRDHGWTSLTQLEVNRRVDLDRGVDYIGAIDVTPFMEDLSDEVNIDEKELRVDVYRSSGAGGQHVNKTESAVRVTHVPTGIVVMMQEDRSQHRNRAKAMAVLRARLYDFERRKRDAERAAERRGQVGSGDRSERIRTYNFPQARVTDHRVNLTLYKLDKVMEGEALDEIIDALTTAHQAELLAAENAN